MPSLLAWLDQDEAERRRMQEVIELFREHDTVDELGIGSIRDAFSNLLFPGTSVLHTRARYHLFIPWIYLELERQRVPSLQIAARARRDEIRLIYALIAGGEGEGSGVIGAVARERLKQLPSYAYWNGLELLGIRLYHGSIDRYHRSLDGYYTMQRELPKPEGDEPIFGLPPNWHPALPPRPHELLDEASFDLTLEEALFLKERIHTSAAGSLLDVLTSRPRPARHVSFPWQHPDVGRLPKDLARGLELARVFSEVMHGASLLFNLMLAEAAGLERRIVEYRERLEVWAEGVVVPSGWSWDEFWAVVLLSNPRIGVPTRRFVTRWFDLGAIGRAIVSDEHARDLISDRERFTKGGQARLHNRRALELWGGASGTGQLSYRWPVVERLVNDIVKGTRTPKAADARA